MAIKYFINGGINLNYGTSGNWSLTDGGTGGAGIPTSADDVFFTALSPSCIVNASARAAKSVDFTGYNQNIDLPFALNISGSLTLSPTMTTTGTAAMMIIATGTLTSNGKTFTTPFLVSFAGTVTVADDWQFSDLLTLGNSLTLNGFSFKIYGGLRLSTTGLIGGTTVLKFLATETVDAPGSSTNGTINLPTEIDAGSGTVTFVSPVKFDVGKFVYKSGSVMTTSAWSSGGSAGALLTHPGMAGGMRG